MAVVWPSKNNFVDGDVLTATNMNNIGDTLNVFNPTSATNGQVWTANGSGSGSYSTPASGGMTVIQTGSLASVTTLTISSIPGTYNSLELWMYDVYASALGSTLQVNANNQSFSNSVGIYQDSGTAGTAVTVAGSGGSGACVDVGLYMTNSSTQRSYWVYRFPGYALTPNSSSSSWMMGICNFNSCDPSTTDRFTGMSTSRLASCTSAITSLVISKGGAATITAGTYTLYGVK